MKNFKLKSRESGFSLIEVSIALMVIGLLMVPAIAVYKQYIESIKISNTKNSINIVESALIKYVAKNGYYPFPANPGLSQNATGFGQSEIDPNTLPTPTPWPVCTPTITNVCETNANTYGGNSVLIGTVPFAEIGIPYRATLDGHGMQLTYAITRILTESTTPTYNESGGAIEVIGQTASVYPGATQRAHYIIISHGEDRVGAFNLSGFRTIPCGTAPTGTDFENCNNDGRFRNNLDDIATSPTNGSIIRFSAAGVNHFDDWMKFNNVATRGLWTNIPTSPSIQNSQTGNVYIGDCTASTCVPESRVEVKGNVRAEVIKTSRICGRNTGNCMDSTVLGPLQVAGWSPFQYTGPEFIVGAPDEFDTSVIPPIQVLKPGIDYNAHYTWDAAKQSHRGAGIRCVGNRSLMGTDYYTEVCNYSTRVNSFGNPLTAGCTVPGEYAYGVDTSGHLLCSPP